MSKQPRNLNAVSGRLQRRMLVAQLSTGTVGNERQLLLPLGVDYFCRFRSS